MKKFYVFALVAVGISFCGGFETGTKLFRSAMKGPRFEIQAVQQATDLMSKGYSNAVDRVAAVSNDDERSRMVTSALFGANRELNPSNVVFFLADTNFVKNGMLRDMLGRRFIFRVVAANDKTFSSNDTARILVAAE